MIDGFLLVLTLATALGCGLVAGALFAFSTFVMKGLARLPASQGIAAMQSINVTAVMPAFMSAFIGSAVACLVLTVISIFRWDEPYGPYLLIGSLSYLIGTFGLTIGYHVPRNDALGTIDASEEGSSDYWSRYVSTWTALNHVRVSAALVAATVLTLSLRAG